MMQLTLDDVIIEMNPWTHMQAMFKPLPLMLTEDPVKTARILAFKARKDARIDGLTAAAGNRLKEANNRIDAGFGNLDVIPFGQPVHGARDYNYRRKAGAMIDKGFRMMQEAEDLERRAEAAANNKSISSDDPQAVEKLTEKLDGLQAGQETMKRVNAYFRKHGSLDGCMEEQTIIDAARHNLKGIHGVPFPAYCLSNNSAEIRRLKDRIQELQNREPATNYTGDGWHSEEDPDDNRIRIYFNDKPNDETRSLLKSHGFRWSPRNGAWQRQITRAAQSAMRMLAGKLN